MAKEVRKKEEMLRGTYYHLVQCPQCLSENVHCYHTDSPVRYYKCRDCGYNFKAIKDE